MESKQLATEIKHIIKKLVEEKQQLQKDKEEIIADKKKLTKDLFQIDDEEQKLLKDIDNFFSGILKFFEPEEFEEEFEDELDFFCRWGNEAVNLKSYNNKNISFFNFFIDYFNKEFPCRVKIKTKKNKIVIEKIKEK